MRSQLAFHKFHCREDWAFGTTGAKRWRPRMNLTIDVYHRQQWRRRGSHDRRQTLAVDQMDGVLLDKLQDSPNNRRGGVLTGHREHAFAVHFGLHVGFAQNRIHVLLDEVGLPFFDYQYTALANTEAFDLVIDQRIGNVQNVQGDFAVTKGARKSKQFESPHGVLYIPPCRIIPKSWAPSENHSFNALS